MTGSPHMTKLSSTEITLPLAGAQPGIWFAELAAEGAGLYWVAQYVVLSGVIAPDSLAAAICDGLAEADTLHARFHPDAEPVQQSWARDRHHDIIPTPEIIDLTKTADPQVAARDYMDLALAMTPDITTDSPERLFQHTLLRLSETQVFWFQRYHHICVDGYSIAALTRRILSLYKARLVSQRASATPFIDFSEVVAEQTAYARSADAESDRLWWQQTLATPHQTPTLSTRHDVLPKPVNRHTRRATILLSASRAAALQRTAAGGGAEGLLAALFIYVHRMNLARQGAAPDSDATLAVGMPFMRRMGSCAIDSTGPMVSIFPVILTLSGCDTLPAITRQLRTHLRQIRKHERYGTEQIQRDLGRVGHDQPLYRTLINLRAYEADASFPDLEVTTHPLVTGPVEDLEINITPSQREIGAFHIDMIAHPALYRQDELDVHADRLEAFLDHLADTPDTEIGALTLISEKERQKIISWSNGPDISIPDGVTTILDIMRQRMPKAAPGILADANRSIDSDRLVRRISQIGRWLIAQEIGPGMIVAMAMPREVIAIETLFGILASGATLLPLDIAHPPERLLTMCADAHATLLLTVKSERDALNAATAPHNCRLYCLDEQETETQLALQRGDWVTDEDRLYPLTGEQAAYILYTSGSTGRPKGVVIPHRGLLNLLLSHEKSIFGTVMRRIHNRRVRAGHVMSLAFDTSWEQLIWLVLGQELHLFDEETRRDAEALVTQLVQYRIDTLDVSPAMMQQLVDAGLFEQPHRLAMIQLGGEAVAPALWHRLHKQTGTIFYNLYGPTEYSVDALCASIDEATDPVIGRPLANTHIQILDDRMTPVPIGITGELYIAGAGLAVGYLGQSALTATRFVAAPQRERQGTGRLMYRSGDRACWRADGMVAFLGRGDRQVKIRGHRVELGEVERVLASLPGVAGALVSTETAGGTTRLLAWCVSPEEIGEARQLSLIEMLKCRLPSYMIPAGLAVLTSWPQNINGKIDRTQLPAPKLQNDRTPARRPPGSEAEHLLCLHMAEALGETAIGPEDDFFMLGGDSITAMSLGTSLRRAGWILRPRDIFSLRRVDRMAEILKPVSGPEKTRLSEHELTGPVGTLPIVAWFTERFGANSIFAHAVLMRIPADLTRDHVIDAMNMLLCRHPALRMQTHRTSACDSSSLMIPPFDPLSAERNVTETKLCHPQGDRADEDHVALAFKESCAALDPDKGRLFQAVISPGRDHRGWILIVIHHLAVDGVSWRLLLPQFKEACEAARQGRPAALISEETSLMAWSQALPHEVGKRQAETALWLSILQTPAWSDGALDPIRDQQATAGHARLVMNPTVTAQLLHSLPTHCRTTTETLLLTAVTQAMRQVFGATRLRVAMEAHGRHALTTADGRLVDPARTIGWFTAEYPVLVDNPAGPPPVALRSVRNALGYIPDRGLGYGLLRYLDPQAGPKLAEAERENPCALLFNYLGRFQAGTGDYLPQRLGTLFADSFAIHVAPSAPLQHALELNSFVDEADGTSRIALCWSWANSLYDRDIIQRLHDTAISWIETLSTYVAAHPLEAADRLVPSETSISADTLDALRTQYGPLSDVLPLRPLHEGLLYLARLDGVGGHYASVTRLTLRGPLDVPRLREALDLVLRVHAPLRARFQETSGGNNVQVIPAISPSWPLICQDLRELTEENRVAALEACEQRELNLHFDPSRDLMVHACLVRLQTEEHVLFLTAHHLVADGWSTPHIVRALAQAYDSLNLDAPSTPYAQIMRALAARDPAPARAAWAKALEGAVPTLLFGDRLLEEKVSEHEALLSPALDRALEERCRTLGLTRNTLMQGAWAATLSILTGRQDILFGTPVSGRFSATEGLSDQIGLFSNTVPVRVTLRPDLPLMLQLALLQDIQGGLLEHDGIGLAEIQHLIGQGTLFDTLLVSENYPDDDSLETGRFAGVQISAPRNRGYTHYPLTLMSLPGVQTRLILECRFREIPGGPLDPSIILERLQTILTHMADPHAGPWGQIDPRTAYERQMIRRVNHTVRNLPDTTLHDLVNAQIRQTPRAIALCDSQHTLTYLEMHRAVQALAMRLRRQGTRPGDIIGIALPRSVHLTLALLATLETGAAWLPLDTGYPDTRLALMIEEAKPRIILTDEAHKQRFATMIPPRESCDAQDDHLLIIDTAAITIATEQDLSETGTAVTPDSAAYLLYTSGSTGRPKGVLVSHRAIVNRLLWMQATYRLTHNDVVLQKTPSSFDVSIWEFFWPLITGARVFMAPPDAHRDPDILREIIEKQDISIIHFVPSMLAAFLDALPNNATAPSSHRLRHIFCSGEALDAALAQNCLTKLAAPLHNLYGPTEAAIDVTHYPVASAGEAKTIPIGWPVWNTELHILDRFLRPTPIGVCGELYLGGTQLAEGYFDQPSLTATRFIANPQGHGARLYRTGDLACWTAQGSILYLGRTDTQIKLRGQRIELAEIENTLRDLPGIAQAAVTARILGTGNSADLDSRQLVAHILPDNLAHPPDPLPLRLALAERLPSHLVPVAIVVMDHWPTSPSGKLDRAALPSPELTLSMTARAPQTRMEHLVAESFSSILETPITSIEDDFFLLGGHSLLAMRLASQLRQKLDRPVSVGQIISASTVARLTQALSTDPRDDDDAASASGMGDVLSLRAAGSSGILFCIHPASGFAWQYTGLLTYLPAGYGLVGLQSPRPDGVIAQCPTLQEACTRHLQTIRRLQPHGPYRLMGYSLGGTLAHSIAAALRKEGEKVDFLALFDTYPPEGQDWTGPTQDEAEAEVERERLHFLEPDSDQDAEQAEVKQAMFADIVANYADAVTLLSRAQTSRFDGTALLFAARNNMPDGWNPVSAWNGYIGSLSCHDIDCTHEDILSTKSLVVSGPILRRALENLPDIKKSV